MTCTPSAFPLAVLAEATRISPHRRGVPGYGKSSDGICGDAAHRAEISDHDPDARGIPHAVDISQSMPTAPFWQPELHPDQFNAHAYGEAIAQRMWSGQEARVKYLVSHNYATGNAKVCEPNRAWHDQPGDNHASHLHVSFTVAAESSTAPFFGNVAPPEVDMPLNAADIEAIRQIVKQQMEACIGGGSLEPPDAHATVVDVVKHYAPKT